MNEEKLRGALRHGLSIRTFSREDRQAVLAKVKGETRMRRKWTAGAALALALLAVCATALAVAAHYGILDFVGSGDVPPAELTRIAGHIQNDVGSVETDLFTIDVREAYYDGEMLLLAVDYIPKEKNVMLLSRDFEFDEDRFAWLANDDSYGDKTGLDVYREAGYEKLYTIEMHVFDAEEERSEFSTSNAVLNKDGTLTEYYSLAGMTRRESMTLRITGLFIEDPTPEVREDFQDPVTHDIWHEVDKIFDVQIPDKAC